jgi:uncharacterized protein (TIGR03435 family)
MRASRPALGAAIVTFSLLRGTISGLWERPKMKCALRSFGFAALASCALLAQDAEPPAFDVASVKPNRTGNSNTHIGHDGGTLTMTNATLKYCILRAYGVADAQVSGPAWLDTERYDIVAKAAADAISDQHPLRLRALLAERFKLAVHRETKEASVYALVVAKNGPKLTKEEAGDSREGDVASGPGHVTAKAVSMNHLAVFLAGPRAALGRVVVNQTGLDGVYSFNLDWTPDGGNPSAPDSPPPILAALQEQLGLKVEMRKAPVEMLFVDHVEKIPTEN